MLNLTEREYLAAQRELTEEVERYESEIRQLTEKVERTMREKQEMARDYAAQRVTRCLAGGMSHVA